MGVLQYADGLRVGWFWLSCVRRLGSDLVAGSLLSAEWPGYSWVIVFFRDTGLN